MKILASGLATLMLTAGGFATAADREDVPGLWTAQVSQAVRHDTSRPLREIIVRAPRGGVDRQVPIHVPPDLAARHKGGPEIEDPVLQRDLLTEAAALATPLPILNIEGLSDDDNAALLGFRVVPPDTEGDVGANHYVQWVNLLVGIYDKATGALAPGFPKPGNAVWGGFGGICESNNDGDPIVLYDHLADRWMMSQFALGADGHQCIAVSATGDPAGAYYRYDFVVTPGGVNDYPKLGVWPDGYYLTVNEFLGSFAGASVAAFERDRMLVGGAARMVKFGPLACGTECFFSLQPSDLDGPTPAAGTPNTFVMAWDDESWGTGANPDGYRLWDFAVNWTTPAASTFTSLGQVDAPEFDANLCNYNPCAVQPRPGERLDTLSQFTMYRAQYRSFPTHATLVVTHTVDVQRNLPGVRWAELRRDSGGWYLYQTGTYSPDSNHRWMSSAAMDKAGNIAVGYSVSGKKVFPSVRYVTRSAADPLGTLPGGEIELIAGAGAQQTSYNRWGDYATMSVDPVDGCTFWFTQEYIANNGSFDFKTRIGSFRMPNCN